MTDQEPKMAHPAGPLDSVPTATQEVDGPDSGVGRSYVGTFGVLTSLGFILGAMAITTYSLVALWPPSGSAAPSSSSLFGLKLTPNRDQQLFICVLLAGGLGGFIHSTRSLYWYVGNRVLRRSWLGMYLSLPIIGSALAVVFCLILRGGLLTGEATGAQVNFFGFAAISALVGLFSPEAAEKLKQVFSTVLAPAESGRDRSWVAAYPVIYGIQPAVGIIGAPITINGENLADATAVLFHGARIAPATVSSSAVTARVPEGASTGPICLAIGDRIIAAPATFHIEAAQAPS
jgi:IPT/TIG domain